MFLVNFTAAYLTPALSWLGEGVMLVLSPKTVDHFGDCLGDLQTSHWLGVKTVLVIRHCF